MVTILGRPFVKRFAICYQTVISLSDCPVLSVTLVHCGQTVGWIKMKLGMQVGLAPGHIVLDARGPSFTSPKGHSPTIFGPYALWSNGWMHQDATWYREIGVGQSDTVLDGDQAPLPKGGASPVAPNFMPISIVAKWLDGSRWHLACR